MNICLSNLKYLLLGITLMSLTSPAYAYLDPGTGSIIIQGLIAAVATSIAFLSVYWQKIKGYIEKKKSSNDSKS
jgi:hypothetical protein